MDFSNYNIGLGITGSFCTFAKARKRNTAAVRYGRQCGAGFFI